MTHRRIDYNHARITHAPAGAWSCTKCHWLNPPICKTCGNCNRPRKEQPCPDQQTTPQATANGDPRS